MAWTTPGTATAGEVLTAAFWNEQVRDNSAYLKSEVDSLFVPPAVKCTRATNLNPYTNNTDIAWTSEEYDTDGMHDNSTNNSRITPATPGIYLIVFSFNLSFSGTSSYSTPIIVKNGSTVVSESLKDVTRTGTHVDTVAVTDYANGTTDYYTARINFGGGTSLILNTNSSTFFSATWLGRTS